MSRIPDYVGVCAFAIKMGVVLPGSNIVDMICESLNKCVHDELLSDGDTVCITESVVARAQNNYISTADIAEEIREKMQVGEDARLGVVFPILSRNRFSLILKGIAMAVPKGEVIVQLTYPVDEVGNQILSVEAAECLGEANGGLILPAHLGEQRFRHPVTGVDYIQLYHDIIEECGAKPTIYLCNDPLRIVQLAPDSVIVANVHDRHRVSRKLKEHIENCLTLQDFCNRRNDSWSEWGLLGSNMSSPDRLKLAPREAGQVAAVIQERVRAVLGKYVEVIVYGDGAYRDHSTGIYELADPQPVFGMTSGFKGKYRVGLKYKYLVDSLHENGHNQEEIEAILDEKMKEEYGRDSLETEGTTPRKVEDILASLADLVSGSSDAGTPLIIVKGFLDSACDI
jgi:F420-0:gamma-glutamyl ligase